MGLIVFESMHAQTVRLVLSNGYLGSLVDHLVWKNYGSVYFSKEYWRNSFQWYTKFKRSPTGWITHWVLLWQLWRCNRKSFSHSQATSSLNSSFEERWAIGLKLFCWTFCTVGRCPANHCVIWGIRYVLKLNILLNWRQRSFQNISWVSGKCFV